MQKNGDGSYNTSKKQATEQAKVDKLRKDLAEKQRERNTLEEGLSSAKTLDYLKEQEAELQKQIEQGRVIISDENASPSEREAAEGRVEERQEELARLQTQIEDPLRERIKEIFQKYGVTVKAIFFAAGVTIGTVICAIKNSLKTLGKGLGNGLKEICKNPASLLPGLLGSIVSFLFKAVCQAVGFWQSTPGC